MAQTPPPVRDEDFPEPPRLRRLRHMVTTLILVLIGGVVVVAAALVINLAALTGREAPSPVAPETLTIPAGETVTAVGEGPGTLLLLTRDGAGAERLRRFDASSGEALSSSEIERAQ